MGLHRLGLSESRRPCPPTAKRCWCSISSTMPTIPWLWPWPLPYPGSRLWPRLRPSLRPQVWLWPWPSPCVCLGFQPWPRPWPGPGSGSLSLALALAPDPAPAVAPPPAWLCPVYSPALALAWSGSGWLSPGLRLGFRLQTSHGLKRRHTVTTGQRTRTRPFAYAWGLSLVVLPWGLPWGLGPSGAPGGRMASGPIHRGCGPGLGFLDHCRGRNPPRPGLPGHHPGLPPGWGHAPAGSPSPPTRQGYRPAAPRGAPLPQATLGHRGAAFLPCGAHPGPWWSCHGAWDEAQQVRLVHCVLIHP